MSLTSVEIRSLDWLLLRACTSRPIRRASFPAGTLSRRTPSVLAWAGQARNDYEEMAVVQSQTTLNAFTRYVLPGLRGANQTILEQVTEQYALSVEPEIAHPAPFEAPSVHHFERRIPMANGLRDAGLPGKADKQWLQVASARATAAYRTQQPSWWIATTPN